MVNLLEYLLSRQDPNQPHTLLTRIIVSICISLAYIIWCGFYGVIAAVAVYLLGVELMGLPLQWMFYPFALSLFIGAWKSLHAVRDYWLNYGHAESVDS